MRVLSVLLTSLLVSACSSEITPPNNESILGVWVEPSSGALAEFTETKVIISNLNSNKTPAVTDYEKIDSNRFHMKGDKPSDSSIINIDWSSASFRLPELFGEDSRKEFVKVAEVNPNELLGTWYMSNKFDDQEIVRVMTYKSSSSFEFIQIKIDHTNKNYKKIGPSDGTFQIKNGFMLVLGPGTDREDTCYVTNFRKNQWDCQESTDFRLSFKRIANSKDVPSMPKGYKPIADSLAHNINQ